MSVCLSACLSVCVCVCWLDENGKWLMRCCSRLEYLGQVLPLQWNILHNDGILTSLECLTNLRSLIKRVIKRRSQPDSLRCINIFVHVFLFLFLWIIFKYGRHWGKGGGAFPPTSPAPAPVNSIQLAIFTSEIVVSFCMVEISRTFQSGWNLIR